MKIFWLLPLLAVGLAGELPAQSPAAGTPERLVARVGGFRGVAYSVDLRDGALAYTRAGRAARGGAEPETIRPSAEQWRQFRAALDRLDVWRWEGKSFLNTQVADGMQWHLEVSYPDRRLNVNGSNSYPKADGAPNNDAEQTPVFCEYLKAVQTLLGGKDFE